jgi:hypothetical protein
VSKNIKRVAIIGGLTLWTFAACGVGLGIGGDKDTPDAAAPATTTVTATVTAEPEAAETVTETVTATVTAEPEADQTEAAAPSATTAPEAAGDMTVAQENAVESALSYLEFMSFSRKGLIDQLTSEYGEGFDQADAEFAVKYLEDNGLVDWKEQAVKSAESYLDFTSFSRQGLINQLTSEYGEQFTQEEAEYAADQVGL